MAVSGIARIASVALLALRAKVIAVLLGPEGIGLLGLLTSLQEAGAQAADGGLSHSAVRQIAQARARARRLARLMQAMRIAVVGLAVAAALAVWTARAPLARLMTGTHDHMMAFGILGAGIGLLMIYRYQQAVLSGFRRVRELAVLTTSATALSALGGVALVAALGMDGLVWAVLLTPLAGAALAPLFLGRLPLSSSPALAWRAAAPHVQATFRVGVGLMISALAVLLTPMILRVWLTRESGLDEAGLFQAALAISMQISGFVLAAAATEYYPRLSAAFADSAAVRRQANDQALLYLGLGAPAVLLLSSAAPWVLEVLYAPAFTAAAPLLQWLFLAVVIRLLVVPVETILMAGGHARQILLAQLVHQSGVLAAALSALPFWGMTGIGVAIAAGQAVHLVLVSLLARRSTGFRWRMPTLLFAQGFAVLAALPPLSVAAFGSAPLVMAGVTIGAGLLGLLCLGRLGLLPQRRIAAKLQKKMAGGVN